MKKNAFQNAVCFINIPRSCEYSFKNSCKYINTLYTVRKTAQSMSEFHELLNLLVSFKEDYASEVSTWLATDNHSGIH